MEEHCAHCVTAKENSRDRSVRLEVQSLVPEAETGSQGYPEKPCLEIPEHDILEALECGRDENTEATWKDS